MLYFPCFEEPLYCKYRTGKHRSEGSVDMAELTLYKDNCVDFTVVSNLFIDQYMKDANDAQLKVYLYLIRMLGANQVTSVSDIADKFNHTEKDVLRSLKYWEKQGVLTLEYDQAKNLTGIHLRSLGGQQDSSAPAPNPNTKPLMLSVEQAVPAAAEASPDRIETIAVSVPEPSVSFVKPSYSTEQLREFKNRENTAQLLFIAEQYIGRPLTPAEMKTILFFTDELRFSDDLIDYLLQYCVDHDKKDFRYIEKVAVNWAQEGITTPKQAQRSIGKYDKNVYTIMSELGKSGTPTLKEVDYINRWIREYDFSMDIILEACQRTVFATDRHRFEYAEGILKSWKQENIRHKSDILRADELHQKKRTATVKPASSNKFNQFTQNDYDFADLERKLISN